jgi:cytochrome c biogenesis protein CcdA
MLVAGWPPVDRGQGLAAWRAALTYAVTWLAAMASLYVCFGFVGALFGNVVQSTRGIMSVVIGALLAHLGWHELEQRVDRATLVRRIGAAVLMTAAIAVYVL